MIKIKEKRDCSGCTACANICPQNCIMMEFDEEGFKYPKVDIELCTNCDLCKKVCPITGTTLIGTDQCTVYAGQNINADIRRESTSGGIFSAIADYVLLNKGVVFAAGYDSRMHVVHKAAYCCEELKDLRMSKYVQSDLNNTFNEIADTLLNKNKIVFFTGTPCQTAGLINYISFKGKKLQEISKEKLITADLICYGVPSPGLYDRWISAIEIKYKSKIKSIYFRDKKYGYAGTHIKILLSNGKKVEDNLDVKSFTKTMFSKIGLRPSCYDCIFRDKSKLCDFTFGDLWNVDKVDKSMDDNTGVTLLQVHSEKGMTILEKLISKGSIKAVKMFSLEPQELRKNREKERIVLKKKIPEGRKDFFKDYAEGMEYFSLINKHLPATLKDRVACVGKPFINKLPGSNKFFILVKKLKVRNSAK